MTLENLKDIDKMKHMRKMILSAALSMLISATFAGCLNNVESSTAQHEVSSEPIAADESRSIDLFAMDTYMTLTAYGENAENALSLAEDKINELDTLLSTGNAESEIYQLNQKGSATLSDTSVLLLQRSFEINESTNGAFDPAVYPLMELWGFTTKDYKVPTDDEIKSTLPLTSLSNVSLDSTTNEVKFTVEGTKIDFGGIAKGYTSAQVMELFKEQGVTSAMVSLGGNVQLLGTKPDGSNWRVAVQNPEADENYLGIIEASDKAIITSGGYERYFEQDGKVYHHIIDPQTGYPADSDLKSVTIISHDGTLADGYSTSLFVMGLDKSIDFWRENSDDFDAVLYTTDGKIYVTEGIKDSFTSDYEWEVVNK